MSTFNELIDFTRSTTGTYLDSVVYGPELVTNGTFDNNLTGWYSQLYVTSVVMLELHVNAGWRVMVAYTFSKQSC